MTRKDLLPIAVLALAVLALLSPALLGCKTYFVRDTMYLFHPWKTLCAELLQKGEAPLWNSYSYCGMPLLANWQSAVFYPFSLLFYIFSFTAALKLFYALHLFLAGFFAYLFARRSGLGKWPSAGMMIAFAFCGYTVTKLEFLSLMGVLVWIFALFLFIRKPALLAISCVFAFLSGYPLFFLYMLIVLSYCFAGRAPALRSIPVFFVLFAGFAAVQLLPTAELALLSARAKGGVDTATALSNSLSFRDLLRLISPLLSQSSLPAVAGEKHQWLTSNYIGIAGMAAVTWALVFSPFSRRKLWACGLIAAGVLLALGNNTPIYPWLYEHTGILQMIRYPAQFIVFAVIGLVVLIGEGLNRIKHPYILTGIIASELFITSWGFQELAPGSFFYERPQSAAVLQKERGSMRFILSPGTEKDRYVTGPDLAGAWQAARGYLYGLTSVPYHIKAAYGFGEPLTNNVLETIVNKAYMSPAPQGALPEFEGLGVGYMICKKPLPDSSQFNLIYSGQPLIYELEKKAPLHIAQNASAGMLADEPGKTVFSVEAGDKASFVWKETLFPGWKAYTGPLAAAAVKPARDNEISSNNGTALNRLYESKAFSAGVKWQGIFQERDIPRGKYTMYLFYFPLYFRLGVYLTVLTLISLALYAIIKLKNT